MVQNFTVFADRSAAMKIRTMKFSSLSSANYGLLVGVVSPGASTKFSSEGLGGNSAKFCTSENFPLIRYIPVLGSRRVAKERTN